jgi:hypothetical protein
MGACWGTCCGTGCGWTVGATGAGVTDLCTGIGDAENAKEAERNSIPVISENVKKTPFCFMLHLLVISCHFYGNIDSQYAKSLLRENIPQEAKHSLIRKNLSHWSSLRIRGLYERYYIINYNKLLAG